MDLILLLEVLLGFFLLHSFLKTKSKKNSGAPAARPPPEPPGRFPIIGHLLMLAKKEGLLATVEALAERHGPIFGLSFGSYRMIVVSSAEIAKECLTTHDKNLANRPNSAAGKYFAANCSPFMLTNGPYWREIKKIINQNLLSFRQLELSKHVRTHEVNLGMKHLYEQWAESGGATPVLVEMKQWFRELMFNNVLMSLAGKRYFGPNVAAKEKEEGLMFQRLTERMFHQIGVPILSDAIPSLEWLDVGGHLAAIKKTGKELDSFLNTWLKEHRGSKAPGKCKGQYSDLIDSMLSIFEGTNEVFEHDPNTVIKSTILTLIVAGTDTSTLTLTWALALLLNHRHMLAKAQEELDANVGKDRNVEESDIENLPYLRAIIKETLRLYAPTPLGIPHQAMDDCNIGGYDIPAGTRVIFNLWTIQRDPAMWRDPLEFMPERFLSSDADQVDVRGKHFELIPFGAGRRVCPGTSFALHALHLALARLLHGFEVTTLDGGPRDMGAKMGISIHKVTPLQQNKDITTANIHGNCIPVEIILK